MQLVLEQFEPCFLVATPKLADPNFHQTVVLLMEYHEDGSLGVVINRPMNMTLASVEAEDAMIRDHFRNEELWYGGPVNPNHLLCVYETGGKAIADDTVVSPDIAIAPAEILLEGNWGSRPLFPGAFRVIAGYAGWDTAQLDQEIHEGAWLLAPLELSMMFSQAPDKVWNQAMTSLGVDPLRYHDAPSNTLN